MNNDLESVSIEIARKGNVRENNNYLDVPILNDFKLELSKNENINFVATRNNQYIEQLVCDGELLNGETFDERLDKVLKETENYLKDNDLFANILFLKEYNSVFNSKIYLYEYKSANSFVRQISAYFVDSKYNKFFQLSLSAKVSDVEKDDITKELEKAILFLLDNIRYYDGY